MHSYQDRQEVGVVNAQIGVLYCVAWVTYAYLHVHVHIYIYIHVYTYLYMYIHIYTCIYMTYTCLHGHCIYTCIYI